MNHHLPCFLLLLVLSAAGVGAADGPQSMRGVKRGEPLPAAAVLVVSINDTVGGMAEPGWPLIVVAAREPDPKLAATPIPANLEVRVSDERGAAVAIPFTPVPPLAGNEKTRAWLAAESATERLAPGTYKVSLGPPMGRLAGWRVESGEFRMVAPTPESRGLLEHLRMSRFVLLGKDDDALAEADRRIAANAGDQAAWVAKGDILMKKDQPDEALRAYDGALGLQQKTDREPIAILARRRSALVRSLEKRGVIEPTAQVSPAP
jgi:hypothetical protein